MEITIRTAELNDDALLQRIVVGTWSPAVSPAPMPSHEDTFFEGWRTPEQVLVAGGRR